MSKQEINQIKPRNSLISTPEKKQQISILDWERTNWLHPDSMEFLTIRNHIEHDMINTTPKFYEMMHNDEWFKERNNAYLRWTSCYPYRKPSLFDKISDEMIAREIVILMSEALSNWAPSLEEIIFFVSYIKLAEGYWLLDYFPKEQLELVLFWMDPTRVEDFFLIQDLNLMLHFPDWAL